MTLEHKSHRLSCRLALAVAAVVLFSSHSGVGQSSRQAQDPEFAKLVKEWTTKPEFLSPLVDHLPLVPGIPTPKDVLGYHIGAPKKLTYYGQIVAYFEALAAKSPRVKVMRIGKTDEGRDYIIAAIGSEESIRDLDSVKANLARLADPRDISEEQAEEIISKTKPIYHFMGGLHSGETGPPEMLMELAYRLAVEEAPIINKIRENVIVTIAPVTEPDGRDRYVDWYYRHLIDIDREEDRITGPPYWGKYIFHDNNRDINYSQISMRLLLDWYLEWHPPIVHDLHESLPYLYTFSGQAPQNPSLDPILFGEQPWFANFEMAQMTKYGMPGVWTHAFVDMWSPGYLGFMSSNHNGLIRMYETFGNGGATTMTRKLDTPSSRRGGQTKREWYRPLPPYKEVEWSIRNNTNYMETGVLSALQLTSAFPRIVLQNFYRKSRNSIESGKKEPPFGFVIPSDQPDMTRVEMVVRLLLMQGIEVERATEEVRIEEASYPAGSFIVKRDQPYGRLAKILLEKQEFPDPSLRTYDDTGWTLGLMNHTVVVPIAEKKILDVPTDPVTAFRATGSMTGGRASAVYAIAHHGSNNMAALRYRLKDLKVLAAEQEFKAAGLTFPAGSFIVPVDQGAKELHTPLAAAVKDLGLTGAALNSDPGVPTHELDIPKTAVFSTWGSTQPVGWLRYGMDQYEVAYDLIYKERVKEGNLRESYDVIVIPHQGGSSRGIVFDIESQGAPLAYTRTDRFKFLGEYGESEDITGGMGLEGVIELGKFVDQGGVLITLGVASFLPPDFGLTRKLDASRPTGQFYAPGPIVEAEILQSSNPIFYGYPEKTLPVRYANGPLFRLSEEDKQKYVLMRFPGGKDSVLSGLMTNPDTIKDRAAIVEIPVDKGRVLLFATNPCWRWQNHGEFNMLFNSILNYNDAVVSGEKTEKSN